MTESPPEVMPMAGLQSGPPGYITISNIKATATNNSFTVTFDTDQPVLMAMDWWSHNDPSITAAGSVLEGVLRTNHTIATGAMPAGDHSGKFFGFSLRLDANDVSGKTLRSYQGFVQLLGARTVAKQNAVNVRWNSFAWNRYTWAQYNPKNEAALVTP